METPGGQRTLRCPTGNRPRPAHRRPNAIATLPAPHRARVQATPCLPDYLRRVKRSEQFASRLLRSEFGQFNPKAATNARRGFDAEFAFHAFDRLLGNGQPHARAGAFLLREPLEEP